ncbi:MAG: DNA adenine methylase [Bergeyella sp.]
MEVLNDTNNLVVNFYQVIQSDFGILKLLVNRTPYSRKQLHHARFVSKYPHHFDSIKVAWAFRTLCNLGFSGTLGGGYKFTKYTNKAVKCFHNKKKAFAKFLLNRLNNVDIESVDALAVIKSRDTPESFFYIDPPYIADTKVNQGHYSGYTEKDYIALLGVLETIEGKFLLSNYPSDILDKYIRRNNWYALEKERKITADKNSGKRKSKTEMLVANYPI